MNSFSIRKRLFSGSLEQQQQQIPDTVKRTKITKRKKCSNNNNRNDKIAHSFKIEMDMNKISCSKDYSKEKWKTYTTVFLLFMKYEEFSEIVNLLYGIKYEAVIQ